MNSEYVRGNTNKSRAIDDPAVVLFWHDYLRY